jgi:simple sugar transport system permease protein
VNAPLGLRLERRLSTPAWLPVAVPVGSIAAALVVTGVILLITGHDPFTVYSRLFDRGYVGDGALSSMLVTATPLLFTGLAAAAAFRMRVFNIGGEGQLYAGAIAASGAGLALASAPTALLIVAMIAAGLAAGVAWAALPGLLKAYTGTSELITSLMFNYLGGLLLTYLIFDSHSYWRDLSSFNARLFPQGKTLGDAASWPATSALLSPAVVLVLLALGATLATGVRAWRARAVRGRRAWVAPAAAAALVLVSAVVMNLTPAQSVVLPFGFAIGLVVALGVWVLYRDTRFGYEVRVVGDSPAAARYAGMRTRRKVVAVMCLSGALAALGGASQIGDFSHVLDPRGLQEVGLGYTGIVVAALARFNPLAVPLVALVLGGLTNAGFSLQGADFPSGMVGILQGALLLCTLAGEVLGHYRLRAGGTSAAAADRDEAAAAEVSAADVVLGA